MWDKAVDTAAIGATVAGKGIAAGATTIGKLGSNACKWIYDKSGLQGAVKSASQKYSDFQAERKETKAYSNLEIGKHITGKDLSSNSRTSDDDGDMLEDDFESDLEESGSQEEQIEMQNEGLKEKAKVKIGEVKEKLSSKMEEFEETQKLKDISVAGSKAIFSVVQFIYKAPGKVIDAIERRAENAESKSVSDELKKLQERNK
ncbi:MAG: hypothetical protein WC222_03990 [Parachlamydiales bacterium]